MYTTPRLAPGAKWTKFADIDHSEFPHNQYHVEDPYMGVDPNPNHNHDPNPNHNQSTELNSSG